jgi:hypothetical protein
MSALRSFEFSGYTLRPATKADLPLAERWVAWDKFHAGVIDPNFWLFQGPKTDSYLLFDGGGPVFFLKLHGIDPKENGIPKRVALHIQFMPCATEDDRERTMEGLLQGTRWLEGILLKNGTEKISFDSQSTALVNFAVRRLGFSICPGVMMVGMKDEVHLEKRLGKD